MGPGTDTGGLVAIEAVFDGWGFVGLFETKIPGQVGRTGSITSLDTFAIPESQDPAFAEGFGGARS